jgi:hypothetical protein
MESGRPGVTAAMPQYQAQTVRSDREMTVDPGQQPFHAGAHINKTARQSPME